MRIQRARARIDSRAAGSPYTLLGVVGRRGADEAKGGNADEAPQVRSRMSVPIRMNTPFA